MMDWTDRHFRFLARLVTKRVLLYTEMVTANAIIHGVRPPLLDYNDIEHPIALQLGGSDPAALARAAEVANDWAYDEINLNVGCPSDRVQSGRFGVCLMRHPQLVAECVRALQDHTNVPVTVKTRIGVDHDDDYPFLTEFVQTVHEQGGCHSFTLHARKAWLKGLSPKENRNIPPLNYERVYQLKRDFPHLEIIINGGVQHTDEIDNHLTQVDGVMLGRAAYKNLYMLSEFDRRYFNKDAIAPTRGQVLSEYWQYVLLRAQEGVSLKLLMKPTLGLFQGLSGARHWRREISERSRAINGLTELESLFNQLD